MNCPKCKCDLELWHWIGDGGIKGLQCSGCSQKWWSDIISDAVFEAQKQAAKQVLETTEFPSDAISDEERRKQRAKPGEF